jgi:hypothetical protein
MELMMTALMATIGPPHFKHHSHHCYDKQKENNSENEKYESSNK